MLGFHTDTTVLESMKAKEALLWCVAVYSYNTRESGRLRVQGQSQLHSSLEASLGKSQKVLRNSSMSSGTGKDGTENWRVPS